MPKHILITGATGNIGSEVIRHLFKTGTDNSIYAGVRNIKKAQHQLADYQSLNYKIFDFDNPDTFSTALSTMDAIFLLRPPHIADIEKYFRPLLNAIKESSVKQIVFLSVQGAERSKVIPHNKIEGLIKEYGIDHIFLRPSYFMQNLTTTLYQDIKEQQKIILPSGKAIFNWIDVHDIGEVAVILLDKFEDHKNKAIELTGYENENFYNVAKLIRENSGSAIEYKSVNPFQFCRIKKKQGMLTGMIMVMIMLHFLPRFQKAPVISKIYEELTGKKPTTLAAFIKREKDKFNEY